MFNKESSKNNEERNYTEKLEKRIEIPCDDRGLSQGNAQQMKTLKNFRKEIYKRRICRIVIF